MRNMKDVVKIQESVKCVACGMTHDLESKKYFVIAGNITLGIGNDSEYVVGDNFYTENDVENKLTLKSVNIYCMSCFIQLIESIFQKTQNPINTRKMFGL